MAEELLGVGFEIHGGGNDLVFPHHENEAAQTRMARGAELAQIWMHNGMLQMGAEKMAKSVGNVALLHEVLDRWGRDALIVFFVTGHYRQPLAFDDDAMAQAAAARASGSARRAGGWSPGPRRRDMARHKERFFEALRDDFNTPAALAAAFEWIREANSRAEVGRDDLREMLGVLGLENLLERRRRRGRARRPRRCCARREEARAAKDFAEADRLRDELRARGWEVRDGPAGPELVPVP